MVVAQSFSKNFGLYGERIGCLHITDSKNPNNDRAMLKEIIERFYSNPPLYGAQIVSHVLSDPQLTKEWKDDVKTMANRIALMRNTLVDTLQQLGSKRDWTHISQQIGMFAYSGLSESEVMKLRDEHVYLNPDGRMSISGVNSKNVAYLGQSIHKVTQ